MNRGPGCVKPTIESKDKRAAGYKSKDETENFVKPRDEIYALRRFEK